jgi:hypothetical protein
MNVGGRKRGRVNSIGMFVGPDQPDYHTRTSRCTNISIPLIDPFSTTSLFLLVRRMPRHERFRIDLSAFTSMSLAQGSFGIHSTSNLFLRNIRRDPAGFSSSENLPKLQRDLCKKSNAIFLPQFRLRRRLTDSSFLSDQLLAQTV